MMDLIGQSRVVLGMGGVGHGDTIRCLKGRDFEIPMCGAVYLTGYNPELTDHFAIGREILCYSNPIDCAEVLHWLLHRPSEAGSIRLAARARCKRDHTWRKRFADLLGLLHLPLPLNYLPSG
jgi:spore maturation protein CgeB